MDFNSDKDILPQYEAAVKQEHARKWQPRQAYQKHTIRKKGCDDP